MFKYNKIYCDFDGTITKKDVVNEFYSFFADKKWIEYEKLWNKGKITSKENTTAQISLVNYVSENELDTFLNSIELTSSFVEFYNLIKSNNIKLVVLSDGFDLFINKIFDKYNIKDVDIYANHLIHENNKFNIEFLNNEPLCKIGAGMCKCKKIEEEKYCYIGDGTSDLCVANNAELLFATKSLHLYCTENNIKHIYFEDFSDIAKYIN